MSNIDDRIRWQRENIALFQKSLDWMIENKARLEAIGLDDCVSFCSSNIDFDNLSHSKVVEVIMTFPGKWNKEPADSGTIHYSHETPEGFTIRCYRGEPPPNCRIEEVEEIVPAVPESKRTVKRLICKEPEATPA